MNHYVVDVINKEAADTIAAYLGWLFWETSTEQMAVMGLPTIEDVDSFIVAIEDRADFNQSVRNQLIDLCRDYQGA